MKKTKNIVLTMIISAGLMGCQKTSNVTPTPINKSTSANLEKRYGYFSLGGDTSSFCSVNGNKFGYNYIGNLGIWELSLSKGDKIILQTNNVLQGQSAAIIEVDTVKSSLAVLLKENLLLTPTGYTIDSTSNSGEYMINAKLDSTVGNHHSYTIKFTVN